MAGIFDPVPLPAFLKGGPNTKELSTVLGKLPTYFDTAEITNDYQDEIDTNTTIGRQSSGNAGREYAAREMASGGNASLAGIVAGQGMLPFLQKNKELTSDLAGKKLAARASEAETAASIAGQMGKLRMDYINTLAGYTSDMSKLRETSRLDEARMAQQGSQFNAELGLNRDKLNLAREGQSADNRFRAAELAAKLTGSSGSTSTSTSRRGIDYTNSNVSALPWTGNYSAGGNSTNSTSFNNLNLLNSIYRYL